VLATKIHWLMDNRTKGVNEIKEHDLKIYFYFPILFNQRSSYSNITNIYCNYGRNNNYNNLLYYPKNK
jgi:hypothetical protein